MVAHRKNISPPKAYVPSSWVIVLTAMVVMGAAGWLGWLLLDDDSPSTETASPSATTPAATPAPTSTAPTKSAPTSSATPKPSASKSPKPVPSTTAAPAVERSAQVSVLNNSGVVGAARTFSGKVTQAGWTLSGIGNWTGSIPVNTVYYPPDLQAQAELLGKDVGIARILPAVSPMRADRLTIILSGPQ